MNAGVHVSLSYLAYSGMASSGLAGSYGCSISSFLKNLHTGVLKKPHTVLYSGCTSLHSHKQCKRVPFIYCLQTFLIPAILTSMRQYLIVVLIYISLIMNDIEHLFLCLLAICISSLEKCLFSSLAHFFDSVICFSGIELHELLVYF